MDQLLTVIVQTSPIPSHPSTALLEALFRSFQKADGLLESNIIIVCDGCEEIASPQETENHKHGKASRDTAIRYGQHLELLRHAVEQQVPPFLAIANGSIQVVALSHRHGSARAIQAIFDQGRIQTPLVMIAQHDNFFVQHVPLRAYAHAMMNSLKFHDLGVKCLHFLSTSTLHYKNKVHKRYGIVIEEYDVTLQDNKENNSTAVTLVPLIFWYGRTHLSFADHYRTTILNRPLRTGDHLEELLGVAQLNDIRSRGMEQAHKDYGTFVVVDKTDSTNEVEVMYHLSGRRVRAAPASSTVAATMTTSNNDNSSLSNDKCSGHTTTSATYTKDQTHCHQQRTEGSFTTARSCRAVVPGLEIVAEDRNGNTTPKAKAFKQKCFHCGKKGHSFKWCPHIEEKPPTETIDLS